MNLVELTLNQFFMLLIFGGMLAVLCVMIPVQIASKIRRMKRKKYLSTCRICGYRFIRPASKEPVVCPHCGVLNR